MMEQIQHWQENNSHYLSVSMDWLRLKLIKLAATNADAVGTLPEAEEEDRKISQAFAAMTVMESGDPLPALVILGHRFGLSVFEQQVMLLCTAMELDTRIPALCAKAQHDSGKPFPTFALAMSLFNDPSWDVMSAQRPLRYWQLVDIERLTNQPLITSGLKGDERIIHFIKGLNYLDERIVKLSSSFDSPAEEGALPASQEKVIDEIVKNLQPSVKQFPPALQLVGPDSISKQLIAQKVAALLHVTLIKIPVELFPVQPAELSEFARLWQRENRLLPIAGYLEVQQADLFMKTEGSTQTAGFLLQRLLSLSQGMFFLDTHEIRSDLYSQSWIIEIKKPTSAEQQAEWVTSLGDRANGSPSLLASQFNLNVTTIREIAARSRVSPGTPGDDPDRVLWKNCLLHTSPQLDVLIQKLELKSTWNDLVLSETAMRLLWQIASQTRLRSVVYDQWGFRKKMNRGLGISALFAGESGTGKTMAAEVLANDLNLHLYRIDLSGVVSKYIGETEKNLRKVFDAAENGGSILFFDEADALFGKRSEVKDSHDRYANIEINYLLQRIEAYNGLAILATNKKNALDEAFTRRLRFVVHFPFPGVKERRAIVEKAFPSSVPTCGLDYNRLALLNLSGGSFHNIALNAAFSAAEKNSSVTMPLILSAAKAEFQKIERPIKEADFLWNE